MFKKTGLNMFFLTAIEHVAVVESFLEKTLKNLHIQCFISCICDLKYKPSSVQIVYLNGSFLHFVTGLGTQYFSEFISLLCFCYLSLSL